MLDRRKYVTERKETHRDERKENIRNAEREKDRNRDREKKRRCKERKRKRERERGDAQREIICRKVAREDRKKINALDIKKGI